MGAFFSVVSVVANVLVFVAPEVPFFSPSFMPEPSVFMPTAFPLSYPCLNFQQLADLS